MTTQELNIANALSTAVDILPAILKNGISSDEEIYEIMKAVGTKYNLNLDQTIIVFEDALKIV